MTPEPRELVLRPAKRKWVLVTLICGAFSIVGVGMVLNAAAPFDRVQAWFGLGFFGLGLVIAVVQLLPGSSFVRISEEGLLVRSLWRDHFYKWSDIESFGVAEFTTIHSGIPQKHRTVGFNFSPTAADAQRGAGLKKLSRALAGFEAALPDSYGRDPAEFASELNRIAGRLRNPVR
jgi:hypothetical protein